MIRITTYDADTITGFCPALILAWMLLSRDTLGVADVHDFGAIIETAPADDTSGRAVKFSVGYQCCGVTFTAMVHFLALSEVYRQKKFNANE